MDIATVSSRKNIPDVALNVGEPVISSFKQDLTIPVRQGQWAGLLLKAPNGSDYSMLMLLKLEQPLDARIKVIFDHPERYGYDATDLGIPLDLRSAVVFPAGSDPSRPKEPVRIGILTMFSEFLKQRAPTYLPEGCALTITFADINLSAKGPSGETGGFTIHGDPMFIFDWVVTDRSGAVIKKGAERLAPYSLGLVELHSEAFKKDPYFFDKVILNNWMHRHFRM
jgi:hypothetical protein